MADEFTGAAETENKTGRGRPSFEPTDAQRATVRDMVAAKAQRTDIATAIGIVLPTLRKYFASELTPLAEPDLFAAADLQPVHTHKPREQPAAATSRVRKAGGRGGRPPHSRDEQIADKVATMAAAGCSHRAIAAVLKIAEPTLTKYYADDLEHGAEVKRAEIILTLLETAKGGSVPAIRTFIDIADKTALKQISDRFGNQQPDAQAAKSPGKTAPLGKKEQAVLDAAEAARSSRWADSISDPASGNLQ